MSWYAVEVSSPEAERETVAAWLVGKTGQAVEERDDGMLVGAAGTETEADALLRALHADFGGRVDAASRRLPDIDWRLRWRDGLGPRRIGRLTIGPSWAPADSGAGVRISIDPETAFGTGEHGSTRTALVLLDRLLQPGDRVLDLGSGSGILAIAALGLGAARATGVDLDPEAEPIARANAARNGVAGRFEFLTGDAALLTPLLGPVELVLANILRSQNEALLPAIRAALAPGGRAILAGMERGERELFLPVLRGAGLSVADEAQDESWWGVAARLE